LELVRPNRASVERYSCGTFASQKLLTIHEPHFIGLLPVAVSTGIGSETQKPLTIIIIGVLVTATSLILLFFQLSTAFFTGRIVPPLRPNLPARHCFDYGPAQ